MIIITISSSILQELHYNSKQLEKYNHISLKHYHHQCFAGNRLQSKRVNFYAAGG